MGSQNTIVDLIKEAISLAESKYGERLVKNESAIDRFLKVADLADKLGEEFEAERISTNIAPNTEEVWFENKSWVELRVLDLRFHDGSNHAFFKEIHNADMFGFATKDGCIHLYMCVKGMWAVV